MVVASRNSAPRGWLDAAPNTPTTPVVKPSRHSNTKKKNQKARPMPTATRPTLHSPIITAPQKTPSVRFDLSSSQNSAFTAVEPRRSVEELPKLEVSTSSNEPQEVGLTTPPSQKARFSMFAEQNTTSNRKQRPLRSGPVDVDEVSITSTFDSVELEEDVTHDKTKMLTDQMQKKFQTDQKAHPTEDKTTIQRRASLEDEAGSPKAPLKKKKKCNWLVTEREPFQRPGMTASPPMSTRYLLASGKTLPEFAFTPYEQMASREKKTLSHLSAPFSPPLSPAQLEESTVVPHMRASSKSPATCSDVTLGLLDRTSPPLSPFDPDNVQESRRSTANASPDSLNPSAFKVHCKPQMMVSALSLPRHSTATTNIDTTTHDSGHEDGKKETKIVPSDSHDDNLSFYNEEDGEGIQERGTATPVPVPPPSSPPPLWRSPATSTHWIQHEKEPFQLQEMMQEEPMSPPISSSNLITQAKDSLAVLSPPSTSPQITFELAETLWAELNKYQTKKRGNERKNKKQQRKLNRKKEIYQQLHHAQQVVRLILKGSDYGDKDVASPQACYEAIRQYAQLRLETKELAQHLEESKIQLRDCYLEWKELRKEMQAAHPKVVKEQGINHESLALLQQLMSDDDSIYKEDDATMTSKEHSNAGRNLAKCESFSVATKVDQEKDTGKAIAALFHQMHSELGVIRSTWQDQRQKPQEALEKRDVDRPATGKKPGQDEDGMANPLEDNDSFLLAKIEELTAQIEDMERNREMLSGFMEQLAAEVIRSEQPHGFVQDPEMNMDSKGQMPDNWATLGAKFPIHRLPMSALRVEDDNLTDPAIFSKNLGAHESGAEAQDGIDAPINTLSGEYQPSGLLLRSRRFQQSTDSFDLLPIHLPKSRGVSFERGELKQVLSDFSEDETRIEVIKLLQQPSLCGSSRDSNDNVIGLLRRITESVSFDSYFLRQQHSETISVAGRKLHSAFLRRKSTSDRRRKEEACVLLEHDSIIGSLEDERSEKFAVDTYSSPRSSPVTEHQPLKLDSQLAQKLRSPMLALELSMPPKIVSLADKDTNETVSSRSSLLQGTEGTLCSGGPAQLQTQQQEVATAEAKLALLRKEKSHLLLGFSGTEIEGEAGGRMITDPRQTGDKEKANDEGPVFPGSDEQAVSKDTELKDSVMKTLEEEVSELREQLAKSQKALYAVEARHKKTSSANAVEVKLLEKAEECERLKCQVTSLADQLENQMSMVADLERQLAAAMGKAKIGGNNGKEHDLEVVQLKAERDEYRAQVLQLTQQLAVRSLQINELESKTNQHVSVSRQSSSSSVNSGYIGTTDEIDDGSNCSQEVQSSTPASSSSSPKRSPARATAGMIRNLFTKTRFSLTSKQGKTLPYAPMKDNSRQEASGTSLLDGSDALLGENDAADSLDDRASNSDSSVGSSSAAVSDIQLQAKTSMDISSREDAQFATIHSLMKKIEELEDENARLKATL